MKRFTFAKLSRTLLLAAVVAVGSVCWLGCGESEAPEDLLTGDENNINTGDNGGDNTGGDNGGIVNPKSVVKSTITDADGTKYKTVKIGRQTWMAENMRKATANSRCYGQGDSTLVWVKETVMIDSQGTMGTVWREKRVMLSSAEVQANCNKYGRLYTWEDAKTVCPTGWRLPDIEDWDTLLTAVGGEETGKKLKAKSGWTYDHGTAGNGTDDYGFSALPGGVYTASSFFGPEADYAATVFLPIFRFAGEYGAWWTSNGPFRRDFYDYVGTNIRWSWFKSNDRYMEASGDYVYIDGISGDVANGLSVRCVK